MKGATLEVDNMALSTFISIHAPMKGATGKSEALSVPAQDFNPRTHEGCDAEAEQEAASKQAISIHAPMKGATLTYDTMHKRDNVFQSTHP